MLTVFMMLLLTSMLFTAQSFSPLHSLRAERAIYPKLLFNGAQENNCRYIREGKETFLNLSERGIDHQIGTNYVIYSA